MAFRDHPKQSQGIGLLQRSLQRGRLAHGYLFTGQDLEELDTLARTLAKTLNCQQPVLAGGKAVDCCDQCLNCHKIDHENHGDVFWVRPESKSRQIRISQLTRRDDSPPRVLLDAISLKPTESQYKVAVLVAADRMNEQAANAFLKTLEEPPARSVLILLTTEPQRLLETILSRCLRISFGTERVASLDSSLLEWLQEFAAMVVSQQTSLIGRYRLLDVILRKLGTLRAAIEAALTEKSPLEHHPDADESLRGRWQEELKAAVEAEYRRQRGDLLLAVEWWLRDVWLHCLMGERAGSGVADLVSFSALDGAAQVARRIKVVEAQQNLVVMEQLQRWLGTNVQEALALEVSLLKLRL